MRLKLSRAAQRDLTRIEADGIVRFGDVRAAAYVDALFERFRLLTEFPRLGSVVPISDNVRMLPHESHVILYQLIEDDVLILAVRHGREDWQGRLKV